MLKNFLGYWLIGLGILMIAILVNLLAAKWQLTTWYDFLSNTQKLGWKSAWLKLNILNAIFLFLIYPLILGYFAYLLFNLFHRIIQ